MNPKYRRRRRIAFWTVFPWIALIILHFSVWLRAMMALPMSSEFKVNLLDFQVLQYVVLVLPVLLAPLFAAVAIEFAIFLFLDWREARNQSGPRHVQPAS